MSVHERSRCGSIIHSIVALVILLGGAGLIGLGIWLKTTDNGGPRNLDFSDSSSKVVDAFTNFGTGSLIVGGFLILAGVASLFGLAKHCLGKSFRVLYILMALIIIAVLIFVATISLLIVRKRDSATVNEFVTEAWERTVQNDPEAICAIEEKFSCRGFSDSGECENENCPLGNCEGTTECARCNVENNATVGCWEQIKEDLNNVYLPVGIVTSVLAAVVLVDIFITCAL